jgi:hypothetical protein
MSEARHDPPCPHLRVHGKPPYVRRGALHGRPGNWHVVQRGTCVRCGAQVERAGALEWSGWATRERPADDQADAA